MSAYRSFEIEALRLLARDALSVADLERVFSFDGPATFEYTGAGYYLTIAADFLPLQKRTCCEPVVVGVAGDIQCGFVVFLGDYQLVLECHTWGAIDVPADFRNRDVRVFVPEPSAIHRL